MMIRKTISVWVLGLYLFSPQIGLTEPTTAGASKAPMQEAPIESGVINRIDTTKNLMVISDMVFGYSALSLMVHKGEHTSGVTSLRPNQKIRFAHELRKPGSTIGAPKIVTEVWIDQD